MNPEPSKKGVSSFLTTIVLSRLWYARFQITEAAQSCGENVSDNPFLPETSNQV